MMRGFSLTYALGAAVALVATVTPADALAAAPAHNRVTAVDVREEADKTVVAIEATKRPTFTVFKLSNPQRLFIDLVDADVSALAPTMSVGNGVIDRVTVLAYEAEAGDVGRVILSFAKDASYDIETVGTTVKVLVDGGGRTTPDLRLQAAEAEAKRVEQAVAREKKLLVELKQARAKEEAAVRSAKTARATEQELTAKVAAAREQAKRLGDAAAAEAAELTKELEALERAKALESEKVEALAKAARAEAARKDALQVERRKAEAEREAAQDALAHEKARLAAMRAATDRAKSEEKAAKAAVKAAEARAAALAELEAARKADAADVASLEKALAKREAELTAAKSTLDAQKASLDEARLAQAQAEAQLRDAEKAREQLAAERAAAADRAIALEKQRADALQAAAKSRRAGASQKKSLEAKRQLEALEAELSAQRKSVMEAREQADVEAARIALLKDQLDSERKRLETAKAERRAEEKKVAALEAQRKSVKEAREQAGVEAARIALLKDQLDSERKRLETAKAERQAEEKKVAALEKKALALEERSGPVPVVRDVTFGEQRGQSEIRVKLTADAAYEVVRRHGKRLEVQLKGATLPRELERSLDTSDFNGPVKLVSTFRSADDPGTVRLVVDLERDSEHAVRVDGHDLVWSFQSRPGAATASRAPAPVRTGGQRTPPGVAAYPGVVGAQVGAVGAAGPAGGAVGAPQTLGRRKRSKKKYKGKKINLTIKDADIQHVLTFLAKEGGVNIVASDEVSGAVTFHLENIPWDLALDMILKTEGYDYVKESGVYRVAPQETIQKEYEAELKRKQTIEELKPLVVRFVTVNYADPEDLAEHIKTVLSKNGTVTVDQSTSTLIVKDTEEHVQASEDIVRRLDVQLPQVLIEARIVEASTSFTRELGIQWGGNFTMSNAFGNPTGLAFPSVIGLSGGADDNSAPTNGVLGSSPNFAVNLPAATGAGAGGALGLTLGSLGGAGNLNLRLSAAEDQGTVKIVSAPKILTLDGRKATIRQGVSIPVPVVSANGVNTQFFNADLKLEVLTNTSPDGNIRLDLDITKNEPNFGQTSTNGAPTIEKKEAKTSLLVRDGDTTVIGGIFTRNTGSSSSSVPFLSKIPILGWFFQNSRETDNRSELLIFITPRIANRRASVVQTSAGLQ